MNADYYNAEPGARFIDTMFYELEDARDGEVTEEIADMLDSFEAECGDER